MTTRLRSALFACAVATLPLPAQKIGEPAPELTWTATHNFGDIPNKKLSDLRGSVVLLDFISVRQPIPREEFTKLTTLFNDRVAKGLVVITITSEAAEDVAKWVKKGEVKRPVAVGFNKDYDLNGIPDAFLIDKDGKLLWHGHTYDIDRKQIDDALVGAKPAIALPGLEEAQTLRRSLDFGATWRKTKQLLEAGGLSDAAQEQAKDWMQTYEKFVQDSLTAADTAEKAKDVYAQWVALQPVADWYQGVPGAEGAKTKFDALVADPKNKKEIEAGRKFAAGKDKESQQEFDAAYAIWKEIANVFPNTKCGKEAVNLMKAYEKDGKLGFDKTCPYCKARGAACPTHSKAKKK
jgi:hypothetical protein